MVSSNDISYVFIRFCPPLNYFQALALAMSKKEINSL